MIFNPNGSSYAANGGSYMNDPGMGSTNKLPMLCRAMVIPHSMRNGI